ncbi:MAG: Rrf2 family transcriptional regulator [Rhodospirillales bacterium]|nr:Rrf2 family transcriptional regulator [Alphaproteobacteria bacterium]MBL6948370.1 Rrf2 family transcriptional regulator [Rhodospirillales bacterium]
MLRLSKKMLFAIEAVLDIAYHSGSAPVQSREITRRQGIPRRYLEQALQNLVRKGILIGVRGPRGGYRLARERRRISIADIVQVVRGMEANSYKIEEAPGSALGHKVVRPLWLELQGDLMERLDSMTVDDLCDRAEIAGIVSEGRQNLDFTI